MPSRHPINRPSRSRKALRTHDASSMHHVHSSPPGETRRIDRPLPASETKHLDRLMHPVPGTEVSVLLRQVSAVPFDSTRESIDQRGRRSRCAPQAWDTGQAGSRAAPALHTTLNPVFGSPTQFERIHSGPSTNTPDEGAMTIAAAAAAVADTQKIPPPLASSTVPTGSTGSTGTTGTTLWLSAQLLAAYLSTLPHICHPSTPATVSSHPRRAARPNGLERPLESRRTTSSNIASGVAALGLVDTKRPLALDLGSGVGYLPLCLAAWGWDVVATDIQPVLRTVLEPNVRSNLDGYHQQAEGELADYSQHGRSGAGGRDPGVKMMGSEGKKGDVWVKELDWTLPLSPELLDLPAHPTAIAPIDQRGRSSTTTPLAPDLAADRSKRKRVFDLILSSDTVYHPPLLLPLFRTLVSLLTVHNGYTHRKTACYLALERRDPSLVDRALELGRNEGLGFTQVSMEGLRRAMRQVRWLGDEGGEGGEGVGEGGGEDAESWWGRDHEDGEEGEEGEHEGLAGWEGCEVWKVRLLSPTSKQRQGEAEHRIS